MVAAPADAAERARLDEDVGLFADVTCGEYEIVVHASRFSLLKSL
jgi:hypothetical protein